jgi:hypothetical protein
MRPHILSIVVESRFTGVESGFIVVESRFAGVESGFVAVEWGFAGVESGFVVVEWGFAGVESECNEAERSFPLSPVVGGEGRGEEV